MLQAREDPSGRNSGIHGSISEGSAAADVFAALRSCPAFAAVDDASLRLLVPSFERVLVRAGEVVVHHGSDGEELYVVVHGRLRALLSDEDGVVRVLGEVGRGGLAGEMAVVTGEPRIGSVVAVRDSELLRLKQQAFERLSVAHPRMMLDVTRTLVSRYRDSLKVTPRASIATVALVPADSSAALHRAALDLVRALRTYAGRVLHVNEPLPCHEDGAGHASVAARLHDLESDHDLLVLQTADGRDEWNASCVRQADAVIVVGVTDTEPALPDVLRTANGGVLARRVELVLVRSAFTEPSGTEAWLHALRPDAHYHVETGSDDDWRRVARCVIGGGTGLVLGGGGARGLAHIGVLRALEEAGIPIDRVGGTSAGANVGAMHALGWSWQRILEETRRTFVDGGSLQDYTLPVHSLLGGRRYHRIGELLYADQRIEDMRTPFFCVSTNLTRGSAHVHRTGLVRRALRASMTVPGIAPAVFEGREVLVDGGVVNNLPVDIMRNSADGPVIAVNVSPRRELRLDGDYSDTPSPWRTLAGRMLGRPVGIPTLAAVLTRAVSIPRATMEADPRRHPDLLLEPPVAGFRLLQWSAIDDLVEIGYRHAAEQLAHFSPWTHRPARHS